MGNRVIEAIFETLMWHAFAWGYKHGKPLKLGSVYLDLHTKVVSTTKMQEAWLESYDLIADPDAGLLITLCIN
jgi:hypothetical protein